MYKEVNLNNVLMAAGVLSILVGIIHSILGEILVFKNLRRGNLVPNLPAPPLRQRNIRILWATWHLASILGVAMGIILLDFSMSSTFPLFVIYTIAMSMFLAGALVCYATKAKHPGWLGLMGVALLCWLA